MSQLAGKRWLSGKEFACQHRRRGFDPGMRRFTGRGNANHSSILAWRIPWAEEPGRLPSRGSKQSDTTEQLSAHVRKQRTYLIV